jgi:hypothetical protein
MRLQILVHSGQRLCLYMGTTPDQWMEGSQWYETTVLSRNVSHQLFSHAASYPYNKRVLQLDHCRKLKARIVQRARCTTALMDRYVREMPATEGTL